MQSPKWQFYSAGEIFTKLRSNITRSLALLAHAHGVVQSSQPPTANFEHATGSRVRIMVTLASAVIILSILFDKSTQVTDH